MLISIIMPVYNNEKFFPLAVESIITQDYTDFELIIVDDGSTDRTSQIADEIALDDKRIKVIHQNNQWIYASFNRGIEEAQGEYIYIVNSDDRLRDGSLKLMAEYAVKYRPDVIWTKVLVHHCDEKQNILRYDVMKLDQQIEENSYLPDEQTVRDSWPYLLFSSIAQNQANLYRSGLMKEHKFRNDVYGADTLFNISIARKVRSAVVLKEPVYDFFIYNTENLNASVGKYYPYEHEMFNEIYEKYMELFMEWNLPETSYKISLVNRRLKQVTREINSLFCANCRMSTEKKLEYILCIIPDETVRACAELDSREEELESRILSGIRKLLLKEYIEEDSSMYFAYELLDSLLRYEKDDEDFRKMESAIWNPKNPSHIGQIFYYRLKGGH